MDISDVIKQDISAAYSAFQNDDFKNLNMFSNRIMANAIFSDDPRLVLIGFYLKGIAGIYGDLKALEDITAYSTAKSHGDSYIRSINLESDIKEIWQQYYNFRVRIREYEQNQHEKNSYKENVEFTGFAFRWLMDKLNEDKDVLFKDSNQFIRGIINEMNRIFRVHGGGLLDLYAISLLKALELYYAYTAYFSKAERKEIILKSILPYVGDIHKTLYGVSVDPKKVSILLQRIIVDWRLSFIYFMERPRLVPIEAEKIPLISEETKKKISDSVSKALKEEVK